jgi:hypothetical protein
MACILSAVALTGVLSLSAGQPTPKLQPPGKAPPATSADKENWKSLFGGKSLDGWKSAEFGGEGDVSIKDDAIVMEKGGDMTGVVYRRSDFPKSDYEVSLEGKKLTGNDFFCTTTFPVGDDFCSLVVGGWGGTTVGLSSIDGMDASMNETSSAKEFESGRWYRVRVRVTKERIQAWIDDERIVDLKIGDKAISIRGECAPCKPFGVATWRTTGAVRNVRVRMLTEAEKKGPG